MHHWLDLLIRCLHIIMIISGGIFIQSVLSFIIAKHIDEQRMKDDGTINRKATLAAVASNALAWTIGFIAILFCLERLKVPLKTLLAVSGIGAVVVGIGARSIIRDFFASVLIVSEAQYYHGDYVIIFGPVINRPFEGIVENISIRITELRERDGSLVFIPNGNITSVSNLSRGFFKFRVNLELNPDMVTPENLKRLESVSNCCRNANHVQHMTSLGVTSIKKDCMVYTYIVYATADSKNDIEAMIQRKVAKVLAEK